MEYFNIQMRHVEYQLDVQQMGSCVRFPGITETMLCVKIISNSYKKYFHVSLDNTKQFDLTNVLAFRKV